MKNKYNIIKIIGIVVIVIGIALTIVSLIRFDVFKYNLMGGITLGLMLPAIGIFLIIFSTVLATKNINDNANDVMSNITKQAKEAIKKDELNNSESATITCKYCGAKVNKNEPKCPSCGASVDKK